MPDDSSQNISEESRRWLLAWARRAIGAALTHESVAAPDRVSPEVAAPRACFVSLHMRDGGLRGCIGTFDDSKPLWENVAAMAVSAATQDYRFTPLDIAELDHCVLEISALTPRTPIKPEDIVVGEHGLWIQRDHRHGVLLPQVPGDYGWDRETFLAHTCMKAGLPSDSWRESHTHIEAFRAEVFSEE